MREDAHFKTEFLLRIRSRKFTGLYLGYLLILILLLWSNWPSSLPYGERLNRGEPLDSALALITLQMIVIFYLALSISTGLLTAEGEVGMRALLLATPQDRGFILRAKIAGYFFQMVLFIISAVPLTFLAATVSDMEIKTILKAYVILMGLIVGLGSMGFFFSLVLRIPWLRIVNWGVILFFWIITYVIDKGIPFSFNNWRLIYWNPFASLFSLSESPPLKNNLMETNIWKMCFEGYITLGVIFAGLTIWWMKKKLR